MDGNWGAIPALYADTAKIWRNKNWAKDEGLTVDQYVKSLKGGVESTSSYTFENQIWVSIITDSGDHWVYFWGVWVAHNEDTNQDYEMPVHTASWIIDGKIVRQAEFFNTGPISLDYVKLEQEKALKVDEMSEEEQ